MTLWAARDGQTITIHGNTGVGIKVEDSRVQEFTVSERWEHLTTFWAQLGVLLRQAEADAGVVHDPEPGGF